MPKTTSNRAFGNGRRNAEPHTTDRCGFAGESASVACSIAALLSSATILLMVMAIGAGVFGVVGDDVRHYR